MYEENENKIQWGLILKRVLMIVGVLLVIIGIIALVNKCTKDITKPKTDEPKKVSLEAQLDELERATLDYLTVDNLPTELNASKTIRLKILINRNLTQGITDEENNQCDTSESYSEITRLENNYAVKMSLSCGQNKESRVIYVGCFSNCKGGICKGEESQTGGVCGSATTPVVDKKPEEEKPSTTTPATTTKPSTTTTKPSISNNNTSTNKPSNSNNSSSGTLVVNSGLPNGILYEHKRCTQEKVCIAGDMSPNGDCLVYGNVTLEGRVLQTKETKTTNSQEKATSQKKTTTVTLTYAEAKKVKNDSNYKLVRINSDGTYTYSKTYYELVCKNNVKPSNGWCYYTNTTTVLKPECEDKTYTYNSTTGKCTKTSYQVTNIVSPVPGNTVCETTWSYSNHIDGWTLTGRVK